MAYAAGHTVHDADSHLMESPDWLVRHADPAFRDRLPLLDLHGMEVVAATAMATPSGEEDPAAESELLTRKNWSALGAFEASGRSLALDLLGFRSQLVFSTYSHLPFLNLPSSPGLTDVELLYAGIRAHNRGMTEFCSGDERLLPVGWVSLDVPELAVEAAREALDMGCAALEVPSYPVGPHSLTHVALSPMYRMLEDAGRPLVFHVGGGGRLVSPVFAENGREREVDEREHAPLLPALTFLGIPAPVEMAVAALVFDGVFERHPRLMCGVIEQGATWVPGFLRRLDMALTEFGRFSEVAGLSLRPSEYVERQVRFTPFHFEDVGWLLDQSSADLYLFSTDYPHDEGGDGPLEWFLPHFGGRSSDQLDRFLRGNFENLMGDGLPSTSCA